jgi:hypothetical protein
MSQLFSGKYSSEYYKNMNFVETKRDQPFRC